MTNETNAPSIERLKELIGAMRMRSNHETFANERRFCGEVLAALRDYRRLREADEKRSRVTCICPNGQTRYSCPKCGPQP